MTLLLYSRVGKKISKWFCLWKSWKMPSIYLPPSCLAAQEISVMSLHNISVSSQKRTGQLSLLYQNVRRPVSGKLGQGQFSFIFYYLPLFLNSMGGAGASGPVPRSTAPAKQNLHLHKCWLAVIERYGPLSGAAFWERYYTFRPERTQRQRNICLVLVVSPSSDSFLIISVCSTIFISMTYVPWTQIVE